MKTLQITVFSLILLSSAMHSCDNVKYNDIVITGKVSNHYTHEAIPNLPLSIEGVEFLSIFAGDKITTIDTILTDKDGAYRYPFTEEDSHTKGRVLAYRIQVLQSENYGAAEFVEIDSEESSTINFSVKPLNNLLIYLSDSSGMYDELIVSLYQEDLKGDNFFTDKESLDVLHGKDTLAMKFIPEENLALLFQYFNQGEYKGYGIRKFWFPNTGKYELELNY